MRKNRERKLNGTYFFKSSFLLDLIRDLTEVVQSGTVDGCNFKFGVNWKNTYSGLKKNDKKNATGIFTAFFCL